MTTVLGFLYFHENEQKKCLITRVIPIVPSVWDVTTRQFGASGRIKKATISTAKRAEFCEFTGTEMHNDFAVQKL
jgi:hypothetical protein